MNSFNVDKDHVQVKVCFLVPKNGKTLTLEEIKEQANKACDSFDKEAIFLVESVESTSEIITHDGNGSYTRTPRIGGR